MGEMSRRIRGPGLQQLGGHPFGDVAINILAPSFAQMPALEILTLAYCTFGEKGLSDLEAALASKTSLRKLSLPLPLKKTSAGEALINAWVAADKNLDDLVFE